jgi:hypothetical protein
MAARSNGGQVVSEAKKFLYHMKDISEIEVHLSNRATREMCSLLFQNGVLLKVQVGASIKNLLCEQLGLDKIYVDKRINTIFLNSQPVDDISKAIIKNNDILALSVAMPGLIGATLRRGSHLAPLRDTITFKEYRNNDNIQAYDLIHLKLFNLILQEVGPFLLQRGVMMEFEDVIELFYNKMSKKITGALDIYFNGKKTGINEVCRSLKSNVGQKLVLLKLKIS